MCTPAAQSSSVRTSTRANNSSIGRTIANLSLGPDASTLQNHSGAAPGRNHRNVCRGDLHEDPAPIPVSVDVEIIIDLVESDGADTVELNIDGMPFATVPIWEMPKTLPATLVPGNHFLTGANAPHEGMESTNYVILIQTAALSEYIANGGSSGGVIELPFTVLAATP